VQDDTAIEVEEISKSFQTGAIRGKTLIQDIKSFLASLFGKHSMGESVLLRGDVSLENTKRNRRFWAVKNVSFSVREGETVALLGKNGAGKSTLLQILCRITEADSGVIRVRGRVASLLGAGVGFNEEMTGRENIYLNGSILGMNPNQISQKIERIIDFAEIPQFLDTPVKRYSTGMKSRLGFSIAVNLDCDIMILDEVFAAGDKVFRQKCINKMYELGNSGRTIIIVAHLPEMLMDLCERGLVLRDGELIHDGDIDHAISLYMNEKRT